jgi:hypothetical protein
MAHWEVFLSQAYQAYSFFTMGTDPPSVAAGGLKEPALRVFDVRQCMPAWLLAQPTTRASRG